MKLTWKELWLVAVLSALLLLCVVVTRASAADNPTVMYVRVNTYLNAREQPTRDSAVATRVHDGDAVNVYEIKDGWARTDLGESASAWICVFYNNHLLLSNFKTDEECPVYKVSAPGRVRVRNSPDGDKVGWVYPNDLVTALCEFDGWVFNGKGWIDKDYLKEGVQQ